MKKKLKSAVFQLKSTHSIEEKLEQTDSLINYLIDHFLFKAKKAKKLYVFFKYTSIFLAAITTITSALQVIYPSTIPNWILPTVSAITTVMIALLPASNAQEIWLNSRTTQQKLTAERFLYMQETGIYNHSQLEIRLKLLAERTIIIWNEAHSKWEQKVAQD